MMDHPSSNRSHLGSRSDLLPPTSGHNRDHSRSSPRSEPRPSQRSHSRSSPKAVVPPAHHSNPLQSPNISPHQSPRSEPRASNRPSHRQSASPKDQTAPRSKSPSTSFLQKNSTKHVLKPGLTLDNIRENLRVRGTLLTKSSGQDSSFNNPGSGGRLIDGSVTLSDQSVTLTDGSLPLLPHLLQEKPKGSKLLDFCYELLEFCNVLDQQRTESLEENNSLSQAVRQLECLVDSVRDRELEFLEQVHEQQRLLELKESKYVTLKKRALQHIKEWQAERDEYANNSGAAIAKTKEYEAELEILMTYIDEQRKEIDMRKKLSKNMPSEKELTDLNLKIRSLQNENAKLMTYKTTLQKHLDELNSKLQKKLPSGGAESLTVLLGATFNDSDGKGGNLRGRDFHDGDTPAAVAARILMLEMLEKETKQRVEQQELDFNKKFKEIREMKEQFRTYVKFLENELEKNSNRQKPLSHR